MKKIIRKIKGGISRRIFTAYCLLAEGPFLDWTITVVSRIAKNKVGTDKCLKQGFLPIPVHFYSPIPDLKDLEKRKVWEKKSELKGIAFDEKKQLALLEKLGRKYGGECNWPIYETKNLADYCQNNKSFLFGCAASLYSLIREFKPRRIVEVGSGNSSKIISSANRKNRQEIGRSGEYTIIDPYPSPEVKSKQIKYDKLIKKRVELIDQKFFERLEKNDILFIDSGHTVRIGSDVNYLYLEVLPRLASGVLIHSHDIDLPYEYPKCYATEEVFRQFWTERYLLQAFLIFNDRFEILLPMTYLMRSYKKKFKELFPAYNPKIPGGRLAISPSFWMKRK